MRFSGLLGAISLVILLLGWPSPQYLPRLDKRTWREFDYLGSFLATAAAVLVVFAFQNVGATYATSQGYAWATAVFIAPIITGVVCWVLLFFWQYTIENSHKRCIPLFPLKLLKNATYALGALNTLFMGFPFFLLIFVVPIRAQIVGGKSALVAGAMLLPLLAAVAIGTVISTALNSKKQWHLEVLVVGSCVMTLGCAILTTLSNELDTGKLLGVIALCGLALGLTVSSSTITATNAISANHHGQSVSVS